MVSPPESLRAFFGLGLYTEKCSKPGTDKSHRGLAQVSDSRTTSCCFNMSTKCSSFNLKFRFELSPCTFHAAMLICLFVLFVLFVSFTWFVCDCLSCWSWPLWWLRRLLPWRVRLVRLLTCRVFCPSWSVSFCAVLTLFLWGAGASFITGVGCAK